MKNKNFLSILTLVIIGLFFLFFYWKLSTPHYLTFSDGAKMGDIARNIVRGYGYGGTFSSYGADKMILSHLDSRLFPRFDRQPLMPISMALVFKLFGVSDTSLISVSVFYYLASGLVLFLLGRKMFGPAVGFWSAVVFFAFPDFWNYALNGASETLFTFEILLTFYFFSFQNKRAYFFAFLVAVLSYFTRPQGFILISASLLYYLMMREKKWKKAVWKFLIITVIAVVIDLTLLSRLTGKTFFYSVLSKGADVSVLYTKEVPATTGLRQAVNARQILLTSLPSVGKKVFYNLYNLYKLLPSIASPYIWALFIISLFVKSKNKDEASLKYITLYLLLASFLSTSVSIPFFRYIHPFVPMAGLYAVLTIFRLIKNNYPGRAELFTALIISVFVVGQSVGILFLDSRFLAERVNAGKKPVYVLLSQIMKDETSQDSLGLTNLDTWGAWYGDRKNVWLPVAPKDLVDAEGKIPFDYIFITSYLIDDENYSLGNDWKQIFLNPNSPEKWTCGSCKTVKDEFKFRGIYYISAADDYEGKEVKAVLLVRK